MVNDDGGKKNTLYLIARASRWAVDEDGDDVSGLYCGGRCKAGEPDAESHCDGWQGSIATPEPLTRCPFAATHAPDLWSVAAVRAWRDYTHGQLTDWPDAYAAPLVAGVRLLDEQRGAAEAETAREHARRAKVRAHGGR